MMRILIKMWSKIGWPAGETTSCSFTGSCPRTLNLLTGKNVATCLAILSFLELTSVSTGHNLASISGSGMSSMMGGRCFGDHLQYIEGGSHGRVCSPKKACAEESSSKPHGPDMVYHFSICWGIGMKSLTGLLIITLVRRAL